MKNKTTPEVEQTALVPFPWLVELMRLGFTAKEDLEKWQKGKGKITPRKFQKLIKTATHVRYVTMSDSFYRYGEGFWS